VVVVVHGDAEDVGGPVGDVGGQGFAGAGQAAQGDLGGRGLHRGAQGPVDGGGGAEVGDAVHAQHVEGEFGVGPGAELDGALPGEERGGQAVGEAVGPAGVVGVAVDVVVGDVEAVVVVGVEGGQGAYRDVESVVAAGGAGGEQVQEGGRAAQGRGGGCGAGDPFEQRSEERRVGKECRTKGSASH